MKRIMRFRVLLVENTEPKRAIHMGIYKADHDFEAIDIAKKQSKSFLRRLECGPNAYTFKAEMATGDAG